MPLKINEVDCLGGEHNVEIESHGHTGILLNGLNCLRKKGQLVDVTLIVGGESFQAHRVVLSACSDYFRAMFTTEVKESREKEIKLEGVSANGMQFLLDYAYTSTLVLNLSNIQDVLSAASHIQVNTLVQACSDYLHSQLDLENCVDVATLAETYSLTQLRDQVYSFMCTNLREFSACSDFQRLSFDQLVYLLKCDYPVNCAESEVLHIVLKWVEFDPSRLRYSSKLLCNIIFKEIPPKHLREIWNYSILRYICPALSPLYKQLVSQMMTVPSKHSDVSKDAPELVNSRGMELAIIKVGGFRPDGVTNQVTYYVPSVEKWRILTEIPHVEQCNFGMSVLNNCLYVVGGCFNQYLQENIHPFGFCYSPRSSKWSTIAAMLTERCRFSLNVVGNKLYAVGGASESPSDFGCMIQNEIFLCEAYDSETDSWSSIASLPSPRTQHAGAVHKKLLFISGGLENGSVASSLLCLDTETNRWMSKTSLLTPRADHAMLVSKSQLYVCGGWCEDESGNRRLVTTIDAYDIDEDRWLVLTEIPTPRYHAGVTIFNDKIYIIGGLHADSTYNRTSGRVECYNIATGEWTTAERYPQDIWEHSVGQLYIPRNRDDIDIVPDLETR